MFEPREGWRSSNGKAMGREGQRVSNGGEHLDGLAVVLGIAT
jgi:hypothetical protein